MIRFTDNAQMAAMATTVRSYLAEAMSYPEAGARRHENISARARRARGA